MLANPYYKGDIVYRDTTYDGIHPRLVDPEIWYKVQTIVDAHDQAKDHTRKHSHYLIGTIYCKQCSSRMLLTNAKSKTGNIYPYFMCGGKHSGRTGCDRPAVAVEHVVAQIEECYRRITIPDHIVKALRQLLTTEFNRLYTTEEQTREKHQGEKNKLLTKRKKLLEAHFADALPMDLLKDEQDKIVRRLAWLDSQLTAGKEVYENAKAHLKDVLDLCGDAYALYMSIDDPLRRVCNQAFFEKIWIADDDTIQAEPNPGFAVVLHQGIQQEAIRAEITGETCNFGALPLDVRGLSYPELVEVAGVEPASSSGGPSLLRVQPAWRFARPPRSRRHVADRPSPH